MAAKSRSVCLVNSVMVPVELKCDESTVTADGVLAAAAGAMAAKARAIAASLTVLLPVGVADTGCKV